MIRLVYKLENYFVQDLEDSADVTGKYFYFLFQIYTAQEHHHSHFKLVTGIKIILGAKKKSV